MNETRSHTQSFSLDEKSLNYFSFINVAIVKIYIKRNEKWKITEGQLNSQLLLCVSALFVPNSPAKKNLNLLENPNRSVVSQLTYRSIGFDKIFIKTIPNTRVRKWRGHKK